MSELKRWTDTDVNVVELLAFAIGLLLGGGFGVVGLGFGIRWLAGVPVVVGLVLLVRSIRAGRRRPWWKLPDGPGKGVPDA